MQRYLPVEFIGENLGQRHKQINKCIKDAIKRKVPFEDIKNCQEVYIIDRLFKIDVASMCRNVDYILETLKERNMLYVSRALKSTWLVTDAKYSHVINPQYLEEELYPAMLTTGVTKMRHFIYMNLKDETRCFDFYQHYKSKHNLFVAKHFLPKCSQDIIMNEFNVYIEDVSPHYLKLLCEKCPRVLTEYFDRFLNDPIKLKKFNFNVNPYLDIVIILLKSQPELYFEMIEKYCSSDKSNKRLSPKATKYIMTRHRDRYLLKPELYGGALLHLPTLARCLGEEEARDLLLRLARARYLEPWFTLTYKSAEPLLKRISKRDKPEFVKQIFVDKNFGTVVTEPPCKLPKVPSRDLDDDLFSNSDDSELTAASFELYRRCEKRSHYKGMPTLLDVLFEKYRFTTFSETLFELKKLLQSESSHKNRLMILNVLVSKTLKCVDHIQVLLELVGTRHANEPITLRASFLRSLVRRAAAYRLSEEPWQMFQRMVLQVVFQSEEEVPCDEGLHAILIHDILNDLEVDPDIFSKFITVFNPLAEYDLSGKEKQKVFQILYAMLVKKCQYDLQKENLGDVMKLVGKILDLLKAHKIDLNLCPEVIDIMKTVSEKDLEKSKGMLMRVYKMRKCRRTFIKENFLLIQNNTSYINALRHDVHLLTDINKFTDSVMEKEMKMDGFLIKLKIYFNDLAQKFITLFDDKLQSMAFDITTLKLCRALCILKGPAIFPIIKNLYTEGKGSRQFAQRLAANVHMAWSVDDVQGALYKDLGAIAIRNTLSAWPAGEVRAHLPALLGGPGPLERLGVALALRTFPPDDIMNVVTHVRQSARRKTKRALFKNFYKYIHVKGESLRLDLWEQMKELMIEFCPHYNKKLWYILSNSRGVPNVIKVDYCLTILSIQSSVEFKLYKLTNLKKNLHFLSKKISQLNEMDTLGLLKPFLEYEFEKPLTTWRGDLSFNNIYIKILTRFLLTCETESIQDHRFKTVGLVFINNIKKSWDHESDESAAKTCLDTFIINLKRNIVFSSDNYADSLPLFNKVIEQMHTFLDVKRYFKLYWRVQLTMVYHKALQDVKKEQPRLLSEQLNSAETAAAVGRAFGRHLADEHRQLVANHFPSVSYIYLDVVRDYIREHFGSRKFWAECIISIIRGVAHSGDDDSLYFAILISDDMGVLGDIERPEMQDVFKSIASSENTQIQALFSVLQCINWVHVD